MTRLLSLLALTALVGSSACMSDPDDPIVGAWRLERTLREVPPGCPALSAGPLDVTFPQGAAPIARDIFLDAGYEVAAEWAKFVTSEFAYEGGTEFSNWPINIGHDLTIDDDDHLVGTATAQGDGETINCHYTIDVVGTRL